MSQEEVLNYAAAIIVLGAIAVGLISMAWGKIADLVAWGHDNWLQSVERAHAEREARYYNMSSEDDEEEDDQPVDSHVGATGNDSGQRIAMRGNEGNGLLPGNDAGNGVVFSAQLDMCLRLIGSGKVGQTEAIEIAFGCKRSGKPDSPYAKARAAVGARMGQKPEPEWEIVSDSRMERVN